ncbi:DUF1385 domain-containing protein [Candidatus Woesearchaeota archaeon]|nr:DUF1385 domain-containing protein [Candidatus Woesearchaeota archaeon]
MSSKLTIGGQAVIEGVMMRSADKYAICVRRPDKKISTKIIPIKKDQWYNKIPIIRGITRFCETLYIGMNSITYSASEAMGEEESMNAGELFFTILLSIGMTILLFYMAPLFIARFLTKSNGVLFNVIDGLARIVIFLAYLYIISLMPDIRRVFQYHGAEHMTVHAYEHGEKLTVKNIRKHTTLHPRCGTNFLLIVFILSIFFFTAIPVRTYLYRLGIRLLLLPLIAGIAYEILKVSGKYYENPIVKLMAWPGLMLQKITTREPEDDMINVAIKSLKSVI